MTVLRSLLLLAGLVLAPTLLLLLSLCWTATLAVWGLGTFPLGYSLFFYSLTFIKGTYCLLACCWFFGYSLTPTSENLDGISLICLCSSSVLSSILLNTSSSLCLLSSSIMKFPDSANLSWSSMLLIPATTFYETCLLNWVFSSWVETSLGFGMTLAMLTVDPASSCFNFVLSREF